jgi:hypothetical protein
MPRPIEEAKNLRTQSPEALIREVLEKEFNKSLPKRKVTIGYYKHEFDLFSRKTIYTQVKFH